MISAMTYGHMGNMKKYGMIKVQGLWENYLAEARWIIMQIMGFVCVLEMCSLKFSYEGICNVF